MVFREKKLCLQSLVVNSVFVAIFCNHESWMENSFAAKATLKKPHKSNYMKYICSKYIGALTLSQSFFLLILLLLFPNFLPCSLFWPHTSVWFHFLFSVSVSVSMYICVLGFVNIAQHLKAIHSISVCARFAYTHRLNDMISNSLSI